MLLSENSDFEDFLIYLIPIYMGDIKEIYEEVYRFVPNIDCEFSVMRYELSEYYLTLTIDFWDNATLQEKEIGLNIKVSTAEMLYLSYSIANIRGKSIRQFLGCINVKSAFDKWLQVQKDSIIQRFKDDYDKKITWNNVVLDYDNIVMYDNEYFDLHFSDKRKPQHKVLMALSVGDFCRQLGINYMYDFDCVAPKESS